MSISLHSCSQEGYKYEYKVKFGSETGQCFYNYSDEKADSITFLILDLENDPLFYASLHIIYNDSSKIQLRVDSNGIAKLKNTERYGKFSIGAAGFESVHNKDILYNIYRPYSKDSYLNEIIVQLGYGIGPFYIIGSKRKLSAAELTMIKKAIFNREEEKIKKELDILIGIEL